MDLRSRQFEKNLRRRVRRTVRASRTLRRQARRGRPKSLLGKEIGPAFGVLFIGGYAAVGLVAVQPPGQTIEARLALLGLWFLGMLASSMGTLWNTLYAAPTLPVLSLLPLADETIGRYHWSRFWRQNWLWLLFWTPFGLAIPISAGWTWSSALAGAGLVSLQYLSARVLAVHALVWGLANWLRWFWVGFPAAIGLGVFLRSWGPVPTDVYAALNWAPVFGWLNYVYLHGLLGGDPWVWTLLLPISAVFWTLPFSQRLLLANYQLGEPVFAPTAAEGDGWPTDEEGLRGRTAIKEWVRSRAFLNAESWWRDGWYERLAARLLTARERLVAEFLLADAPGWSLAYRRAVKRWVIGMVVALGVGMTAWQSPSVWILPVLPLLLSLNIVLPQPGGAWTGLKPHWIGGAGVPPFAAAPLSHREISRLLEKLCLLRFFTGLPLLLGITLLAAWSWREVVGYPAAFTILLKVVGIVVAGVPLVALQQPLAPNNGDQAVRWSRLPLLLLAVLVLGGSLVGAIGCPDWRGVLASLAVLAVAARLFCWLHCRAWARGRFDMLVANCNGG